jgi:hypothetical protein
MGFCERDNEFSHSLKDAEINQSLYMRIQRNRVTLFGSGVCNYEITSVCILINTKVLKS